MTIALVGALAYAAPALASYSPRLAVTASSQSLGGAGARISYSQSGADDPTQKVSVLVPKGYSVDTGGANGTKIGSVQATVIASDLKATAKTTGSLVVAGRSDFPTEAQACVGNQTPSAVWAFTLVVRGTAFRIPVFVDTSPPEPGRSLGVASITVCFQAGDTPKGSPNRAVLGSRVINFALTTKAVSSPKEKGTYRWRASITPYTPGTGQANLKGIVEVQSLVPLPLEISLDAKVSSARKGVSKVALSGVFSAAGNAIPGIFLTLERGTTARNLKRLGVISTNSRGEFGTTGDVAQTSSAQRFFVHVTTTDIVRDLGIAGCQATTAGVPCVDATVPYNVSSKTLAIRIPARS